ncbi:type II toxin-antitoxin system PemK/MazF family toxin [Polynucleobacter paneuropaeus]|nr:type II toxin-antitoxin system PemK/MazF family toxin [Polynucleobacter paneuropaeus]
MKRGSLVTIAMQGDFGKPRPALVIQSDVFNVVHSTVTVLLVSGEKVDAPLFRLDILPSPENGLTKLSQIQVDKIMSVRSEKIGSKIGQLDDAEMLRVNRALGLWLGLG